MKTFTIKKIVPLIIFLLLLVAACSEPKHTSALLKYQEALHLGDIDMIVSSLEQLSILTKIEYNAKLTNAYAAQKQFNSAKAALNNSDYVTAYLSSHQAYRALPLKQSKALLITTGKTLIPLLRVQSNLEYSFELNRAQIIEQLQKYQHQAVEQWNLIAVNTFIKEINLRQKSLQKAIHHLKKIDSFEKEHPLLSFQQDINQQRLSLLLAKQAIINMAQAKSANVLLSINEKLVEESTNMLSLIRPSLSKEHLQPIFFKAQLNYQTYFSINENLSLADASSASNSHSSWYKKWHEIESGVLNTGDDISKYPLNSSSRILELNFYKNKYDKTHFLPKFNYQNMDIFMAQHKKTQALINTLKMDKNIINYGISIKQKEMTQ